MTVFFILGQVAVTGGDYGYYFAVLFVKHVHLVRGLNGIADCETEKGNIFGFGHEECGLVAGTFRVCTVCVYFSVAVGRVEIDSFTDVCARGYYDDILGLGEGGQIFGEGEGGIKRCVGNGGLYLHTDKEVLVGVGKELFVCTYGEAFVDVRYGVAVFVGV